jgi:hypothetical protein
MGCPHDVGVFEVRWVRRDFFGTGPSGQLVPPKSAPPIRNQISGTNANSPGVADDGATALTKSFPKWAAFNEQLDEMNPALWFTYSSTRRYGQSTAARLRLSEKLLYGSGDESY